LRHARPAAEIAKLDKRYRLPQCELGQNRLMSCA
jgi:hypothetical protein